MAEKQGFTPNRGVTTTHTAHDDHYDHHDHDGWTPVYSASGLPSGDLSSSGQTEYFLYLENDINLNQSWDMYGNGNINVYLCLNGYSILKETGDFDTVIGIEGIILNIYDVNGNTGKITHASGQYGGGIVIGIDKNYNNNQKILNMYGGKITGNNLLDTATNLNLYNGGAGVLICEYGIFNMYGGEISGNITTKTKNTRSFCDKGGGVYAEWNSSFNMYGGNISNNSATDTSASNVFLQNNNNHPSSFTMTGGTIDGGFFDEGNRFVTVTFNAGSGSGTMSQQYVQKGTATALKANEFTAPAHKVFNCWKVGETTYADGANITISSDTELIAQWKDKTAITPAVNITGWKYGEYNSTANAPVVTGNSGSGEVTYYYEGTGNTSYSRSNTVPVNAGTYKVTAEIAENDTYASGSASNTFTIGKRAVTLTSVDEEKTYDGTPLVGSTVSVSGDGFATGEDATYNLTGSQTGEGTSSNSFAYTLNNGTLAENYDISKVEGQLKVNKRNLTITAKDQSVQLNGTFNTGKDQVILSGSGLATGEELSEITLTPNKATNSTGSGEMTPSNAKIVRGTTDVTGNYEITYVNGNLTVTSCQHDLISHPEVKATCTTAGNSAYWECNKCHAYFSDENGVNQITENSWVVAAEGHTLEKHDEVKATCTTAGNNTYWECKKCHAYFSDEKGENAITENSWIVAAEGHTLEKHDEVKATCTTAGNNAYWECKKCHAYFSDEKGENEIAENAWVVAAEGHKFENGKCSVCGAEDPDYKDDDNYNYSNYYVPSSNIPEPEFGTKTTNVKNDDGSVTKTIVTKYEDGSVTTETETEALDGTVTKTVVKVKSDGSVTNETEIDTPDGTVTKNIIKTKSDGSETVTDIVEKKNGNRDFKEVEKDKNGDVQKTTTEKIRYNSAGTKTVTKTVDKIDGYSYEETTKTYMSGKVTSDVTIVESDKTVKLIKETRKANGKVTTESMVTTPEGKKTIKSKVQNTDKSETVKLYSVEKSGAVRLEMYSSAKESVTIPTKVKFDGVEYPVDSIAKGAFEGNTSIKTVKIKDNIRYIGAGAFEGAENLENIYISGKSLKTVKPDAFSGISENAVFHITAGKKRYNKIVNQINNSEIADTVKFERKKVK